MHGLTPILSGRSAMNACTAASGKQQKTTVASQLLYVLWKQGLAHAGLEAEFEVKTALVGDGATVKVTCYTENGKKLCQTEGEICCNRFIGKVLIPEKTEPDVSIYLEVKLPRHSLSGESNLIPVRPLIGVSSLQWSKKEIGRGEEVNLTCIFNSGVNEGDPVTVSIYEYDRGGCHDPVVTIPAEVRGGKIAFAWKFEYQDDTAGVPTSAELKKCGKQYRQPGYFFTVTIDGQVVGGMQESGILIFNDTVTTRLSMGRTPPRDKRNCILTHADGSEISTLPDTDGMIRIEKAVPGPFTVTIEGSDLTVAGKSGTPLNAVFPDDTPITDIHMHTQSNNCCPLPLQWAVIAKFMGSILGRPINSNRKNLSDLMTSRVISSFFSGRFGNIGRISSDLIGKLYLHDLRDADMNMEISWIVENKDNPGKTPTAEDRRIAGKKAGLSKMSGVSVASWQEGFLDATKYYFAGTRIHRLCLSLSMDLSCATYWSRTGLPFYLPGKNKKTMLFINDFAAAEASRGDSGNKATIKFLEGVVNPRSQYDSEVNRYTADATDAIKGSSVVHLHAAFFPGDRFYRDGVGLYRSQYDLRRNPGGAGENEWPLLSFDPETAGCVSVLDKKFVHALSAAHDEDNAHFEDYALQRKRIIDTMINYPLALFGAYHFDPRRHLLAKTTTITHLAEAIIKDHAFFAVEHDATQSFVLSNGVEYRGAVKLTPHKELNSAEGIEKVLLGHQHSIEDAMDEIFIPNKKGGSGLFWAIKMYPRLGYAPDDFLRYPNLSALYAECQTASVPIMAHCSPGGMFAADYFLYERYDDHIIKNEYDLDHAEKRFDGVLPGSVSKDSPLQWATVLEKYPRLKLCLAHFGGYETWKRVGSFSNAEKDLEKRPSGRARDRYDNADLYRDWIKTIAELADKHDHVYTDLSYFNIDPPAPAIAGGNPNEEGSRIDAEQICFLLKKYPGLKDRVMTGTDWYLIEKEGEKGLGDYMHRWFETLKMASREVGFDTWHQFSVVNPLRYLGLIEEKKGSKGPFEVKIKVLEEYGERLKERINSKKGKKKLSKKSGGLFECIDTKVDLFKNLKIIDSSLLKKDNNLLILCE
jgi:hypothetical protein